MSFINMTVLLRSVNVVGLWLHQPHHLLVMMYLNLVYNYAQILKLCSVQSVISDISQLTDSVSTVLLFNNSYPFTARPMQIIFAYNYPIGDLF